MDRLKKLLLRGIEMFNENNIPVFSGHATLLIITAMFPFMILIISIVNLLPGYSAKNVADILFQILPDLAPVKDMVASIIVDIKDQSGGLLASVAAVTTLWSASKGVSAIQKGLNQLDRNILFSKTKEAENNEKPKKGIGTVKNILKRLLFTLMLVILIPALLVFEMLGDSIAGMICSALEKTGLDVLITTRTDIDFFFNISSLAVILFAFLVIIQIYTVLPAVRRTLKSQIPGAVFTGVCWIIFTELFSFFIPRFYRASNLYGSLAALFLVLLWLRFVIMILFAGGILNRVLEENRRDGSPNS